MRSRFSIYVRCLGSIYFVLTALAASASPAPTSGGSAYHQRHSIGNDYKAPVPAPDANCAPVVEMAQKQNGVKKMRLANRSIRGGRMKLEEWIVIDLKVYSRAEKAPWRIGVRRLTRADSISKCRFIGADRVNRTVVKIYEYDRQEGQVVYRIRTWIDTNSGLPVKSHWTEIKPNIKPLERDLTYFYDADVQAPI